MEKNKECPTSCPFLGIRSFLPETIPFYCEKYGVYLGMTPAKKVSRCALCQGINIPFQQLGLELLEVGSVHVAEFKKAFLEMRPADQKELVNMMLQMGIQVQWPEDVIISPVSLLAKMKQLWLQKKKKEQSPEVQEFLKLLDVVGTGGDTVGPMTKTLLSNLFQVLDNSEKGMLLGVLENPTRAKSFLDAFLKIPHDQSLLKNFRMLLYDMDSKNQENEKGNRLLITEKGHAMTLAQHMQLQHLMRLMTQARSHRRERS